MASLSLSSSCMQRDAAAPTQRGSQQTARRAQRQGSFLTSRSSGSRAVLAVQQCGRRLARLAAGGGGFGAAKEGGGEQDPVEKSRSIQLEATQLLVKMLEAEDPTAVAAEHVDSIDEQFMRIASTYMQMAEKEGTGEVVDQLQRVLKAAMAAKQATLRPEIQLLNNLLMGQDTKGRWEVLHAPGARAAVNDYFFGLVERMQKDVQRQPDNPLKPGLLLQLEAIKAEAAAAAALSS